MNSKDSQRAQSLCGSIWLQQLRIRGEDMNGRASNKVVLQDVTLPSAPGCNDTNDAGMKHEVPRVKVKV